MTNGGPLLWCRKQLSSFCSFAHAGFSKEREYVDLVARRVFYKGLLFKFVTT